MYMPNIRPISDLRNNANEISEFCRTTREPVFITKNGSGDMVVMSVETYERREAKLELYAKLAEAELDAASGNPGADFKEFAGTLRRRLYGAV
jgi:prevent-host-death family protein